MMPYEVLFFPYGTYDWLQKKKSLFYNYAQIERLVKEISRKKIYYLVPTTYSI